MERAKSVGDVRCIAFASKWYVFQHALRKQIILVNITNMMPSKCN